MKYTMQNQSTLQKMKKKRTGIDGTAPNVADARLAVDRTATDMMSLMEKFWMKRMMTTKISTTVPCVGVHVFGKSPTDSGLLLKAKRRSAKAAVWTGGKDADLMIRITQMRSVALVLVYYCVTVLS